MPISGHTLNSAPSIWVSMKAKHSVYSQQFKSSVCLSVCCLKPLISATAWLKHDLTKADVLIYFTSWLISGWCISDLPATPHEEVSPAHTVSNFIPSLFKHDLPCLVVRFYFLLGIWVGVIFFPRKYSVTVSFTQGGDVSMLTWTSLFC